MLYHEHCFVVIAVGFECGNPVKALDILNKRLPTRIVAFVEANQPKDEPAPEGAVPEVEAEVVEEAEEA